MTCGFTLIELMITIAIFSITLTFGVSSYRTWVQSTQIRNAAESIQDGIQRARAEAVKCNSNVTFALGAASAWTVAHVSACGTDAAGSAVESRTSKEGSSNVTVTATPAGATTITFSNLGTVAANADFSATLAQVDFDSTVSAADLRKLRVTIGPGGNARVCDPNLSATSTDPRRCF
jgi:type IV fimbrial biogenesis protein FimT